MRRKPGSILPLEAAILAVAVELAKAYGATESRQFINGVLDKLRRDNEGG